MLNSSSIRTLIPAFFFLVGVAVAAVVAVAPGSQPTAGVAGILLVAALLGLLVREILRSEADAYRELDRIRGQLEEAEEVARMGYWTRTLPSGEIEWSRRLYGLYGLDPEETEAATETFLAAVHPDDRASVEEALEGLVEEGFGSFTHRIVRPDGEVRWVEHRGMVQTDEWDRPVKAIGATTDVTDRVVLEVGFAEAQELACLGSWEWDVASDAFSWSDEQYRLFGLEPGEPPNPGLRTFLEGVHPEDREDVEEAFDLALEEGVFPPPFEYRTRQPDGTVRWLEVRGEVPREGGDQVGTIHGTNLDVTDRKHLIRDLEEARRDAEAASRAKSRFLANTSHEIRTPLNAIQGFADLLLGTDADPDQREPLETIRSSSEHLGRLVDDILDISRIEAGKLELDERLFELRPVVEKSVQLLATRAGEKGLEMIYDHGTEVPEAVEGDPDRLRQILVNLLSNAIKFTETGEVTLRIRSRREGAGDGEVTLVFEVEDTGVGIPEDDRGSLFESFRQVDNSYTRPHEGTGLGLAITQELVTLMDGTIDVETAVGEGSTFTVAVPVPVPTDQPIPPWEAEPEPLRGAEVLIVDDNPATREVLVKLATAWGREPHAVATAQEAFDRVEASEPALVLLDHEMPGTSGIETARRIREGLDRRDLPLVLLGSLPGTRSEAQDSDLAFTDVLLKPVTPSNLLEACRRALGGDLGREPETDPLDRDFSADEMEALVVDDHAVNRLVVTRMLERLGVGTSAAFNGDEALEALEEDPYDLVLMDVQMPGIDGLETTRRIRGMAWEDGAPRIVALTAHASPEDRQRCLDAGMDGYLGKPIDVEALVATLEEAAGGRPARSATSEARPVERSQGTGPDGSP